MNERLPFYLVVTALLSLCTSTAFGAEVITDAKLEDDGRTLLLTVGTNQTRYTAPKGKFWEDLVVAGNKQRAFAVLQRGSRTDGWNAEDVHEFSVADFVANPKKYKLRTIPLVSKLADASVIEVFDSSQDGFRLLVSVHYRYARSAGTKSYRSHPYFFDTRTGEITIVAP